MRLPSVLLSLSILCISTIPTAAALDTLAIGDQIYAFVGELEQRSPSNFGNNATFGAVITDEGVVLIDSGGSWRGAEAIMNAVSTVTALPVKIVINTGGQDHRWLGNGFFKAQGATVIASAEAVEDQQARSDAQLSALTPLLGNALENTAPVYADIVFEQRHHFTLGGVQFEIHQPGPAHTPGDSFVWLAQPRVVFSGDIVYVDRLLGVGPQSHAGQWIDAFDALAELEPTIIIPGHGQPTTLAEAKAQTYDYLVNLRTKIGLHIDAGGDMVSAVEIDQSEFSFLLQFDSLARRNAQQVFAEMEFE